MGADQDCTDDQMLVNEVCRDNPDPCCEPPPGECFEVCSYLAPDYCWTECLTGDAGCPCFDRSHCQGSCVATHCDQNLLEGECSVTDAFYMLGCHCYMEAGVVEGVCAD